jgi:hypothetical protein
VRETTDQGWARLTIGGLGDIEGQIVDFDARRVVVAPSTPVRGALGASVVMTLGIGAQQATGLAAMVSGSTQLADGRHCLVLELAEAGGRQRSDRVPFAAKVDILVVSGRAGSDAHLRAKATDLSARGIGVRLDRDLPTRTVVLLRFPVPPNRGATAQVRGHVVSCRADGDGQWLIGIAFERVTSGVSQQLLAAVRSIAAANAR